MCKIKQHDVQSIDIKASPGKVFEYIANPLNLPKWTSAFKEAGKKTALLVTPNGELNIGLETRANRESGTIDWHMKMPDGNTGTAFSRVLVAPDGNTIYSFVLIAPPVPLEMLEGALSQQKETLKKELINLQRILEDN